MSNTALQKNLERIIKDQNCSLSELERKANMKKNGIYNILKGISKKPSAEALQAISKTLGVTIDDLYDPSFEKRDFLDQSDLDLIEKIVHELNMEIKVQELQITEIDLTNLILEIFNYSKLDRQKEIDKRFIKWIIQQRTTKK